MADLSGVDLTSSTLAPVADPEEQFLAAIEAAGMVPPQGIVPDGRIHRFNPDGRPKNKSGWYVYHGDHIPAGMYGDWKTGVEHRWRADPQRPLSMTEELEIARRYDETRRERESAQRAAFDRTAETAAEIWESAPEADSTHPYLARKGVGVHRLRVTGDGRLIVPVYNLETGEIRTLQYIDASGGKRFHPGGEARGGGFILGDLRQDAPCYVAEGYATAASIYEATGSPVAIAFNAGNLGHIVEALRRIVGDHREIVVVADNDISGVGQRAASSAAAQNGARVVIPPVVGDVNDYVQAGNDLRALLASQEEGPPWLIPADEFCQAPAPIRWLVKRWIQVEALIMIHGPSGSGKTFVALDWACRIGAGLPDWCGQKVRPGQVVYLAGEGHHGLRARVRAWKIRNGVEQIPGLWLSREGCDLNTTEGYLRVLDAIRAQGITPDLIVVDTLHRFFVGDENSAQDTKVMLDACSGLMRELHCAVELVHHTGVAQEAQHRARGSSAWRGALDVEISVEALQRSDDSAPQLLRLVQRKAKDAEIARDILLQIEPVDVLGWLDEDGETVASAVVVEASEPDAGVQAKAEKRLSSTQRLGMDSFHEAARECGKLDEHGRFCGVELEDWRSVFYRMSPADQEAKKKAFQRVRIDLVERGRLSVSDGRFRLAGDLAGLEEGEISSKINKGTKGTRRDIY